MERYGDIYMFKFLKSKKALQIELRTKLLRSRKAVDMFITTYGDKLEEEQREQLNWLLNEFDELVYATEYWFDDRISKKQLISAIKMIDGHLNTIAKAYMTLRLNESEK